MSPSWTVIKIGGSLLATGHLSGLLRGVATMRGRPIVIVPGGGVFADAVRSAQAAAGFSDALAHRLALDAMDRMGLVFAAIEPSLCVVSKPEELGTVVADGRAPIWSPVDLKEGHPAIEESWAVTSDSLAVWLATAIRAGRTLLVKSTDPEPSLSLADLSARGVVDEALPGFARHYRGTIEILGPARWATLAGHESVAA